MRAEQQGTFGSRGCGRSQLGCFMRPARTGRNDGLGGEAPVREGCPMAGPQFGTSFFGLGSGEDQQVLEGVREWIGVTRGQPCCGFGTFGYGRM